MTVQIKHDGMENQNKHKNNLQFSVYEYLHGWTSKINRQVNLLVSN